MKTKTIIKELNRLIDVLELMEARAESKTERIVIRDLIMSGIELLSILNGEYDKDLSPSNKIACLAYSASAEAILTILNRYYKLQKEL